MNAISLDVENNNLKRLCENSKEIYKICCIDNENLELAKKIYSKIGFGTMEMSDIDHIFRFACYNGNKSIVEWMISFNIINKKTFDSCPGWYPANLDIIKLLISIDFIDLNKAFVDIASRHINDCVSYSGKITMNLIQSIYNLKPNAIHLDNEEILFRACYWENLNILQWIYDNNPSIILNKLEYLFDHSCNYKKSSLVRWLLSINNNIISFKKMNLQFFKLFDGKFDRSTKDMFDVMFEFVVDKKNNLEINLICDCLLNKSNDKIYDFENIEPHLTNKQAEQFTLQEISDLTDDNIKNHFFDLCKKGNLYNLMKFYKYIKETNITFSIHVDYDLGFVISCKNGNIDVAEWLLSSGSIVKSAYDDAYVEICKNNNPDMVKWFVESKLYVNKCR